MQYRKATPTDTDQSFHLVQHTITQFYPRYYPREVVDFFCAHHSREDNHITPPVFRFFNPYSVVIQFCFHPAILKLSDKWCIFYNKV